MHAQVLIHLDIALSVHICDRGETSNLIRKLFEFSRFTAKLHRPRKFDRPFCFRAIDTFVWVIRVCGIA